MFLGVCIDYLVCVGFLCFAVGLGLLLEGNVQHVILLFVVLDFVLWVAVCNV